jgi:hypothetical protein
LKQLVAELQTVADDLRAANQQQPSKTKKSKKKKPAEQSPQRDETTDLGAINNDADNHDSLWARASSTIADGLSKALSHRAVFAFGVAAYLIYSHGEMASV